MPTQRGKRRDTSRTRQPAKLPARLSSDAARLASDTMLERLDIAGNLPEQPRESVLSGLDLTELRWTGGGFAQRTFLRLRGRNVVFDRCDFSGALLQDCSLNRVEFHECRMSGLDLAGSFLEDVLFSGCKLDLANLRMIHGRRVDFHHDDLREADLTGAELISARMQDSDLTGLELSQARLDGLRLHGSAIHDIRGVSALRGAVVGRDQVMDLATVLFAESGISVDDERDPHG
jgi:uncharacterized protein YjbI with pentapeptide repeats